MILLCIPCVLQQCGGQVLGPNNSVPCPKLDLIGGFRAFFDNAVNKSSEPSFDPYANDINFLLATWSLEEIGSTGDKVRQCCRRCSTSRMK